MTEEAESLWGKVWSQTRTNFRKYKDEVVVFWTGMRTEHLPRFKQGSWDPRQDENYYHLTRNLFTETVRAMPRILSGIFIIWVCYKLISAFI